MTKQYNAFVHNIVKPSDTSLKYDVIDADNGLSLIRHQGIIVPIQIILSLEKYDKWTIANISLEKRN